MDKLSGLASKLGGKSGQQSSGSGSHSGGSSGGSSGQEDYLDKGAFSRIQPKRNSIHEQY